jgi:HEAT repeat protein
MNRLEDLIIALKGEDSDAACAAASAISDEAKPDWLPRLIEVLSSTDDFFVREALAAPVGILGGLSVLLVLLEAKKKGDAEHSDSDGLVSMICDVVVGDRKGSEEVLCRLAKSGDPADRENAAWLLDFVRGEKTIETLKALIRDPSAKVTATALRSLSGIETDEALAEIRALPWITRWKFRSCIRPPKKK